MGIAGAAIEEYAARDSQFVVSAASVAAIGAASVLRESSGWLALRRGRRSLHSFECRDRPPAVVTLAGVLRRGRRQPGQGGPDVTAVRRMMFGDCSLDEWPAGDADESGEPWQTFVTARAAARSGDVHAAERLWRSITMMPGIESRNVLQAWHFLRAVGVSPRDDDAKTALGAVAEVAVAQGHDLLAAYEDGSVRYLNYGGAAVFIDTAIAAVQAGARAMLEASQPIAEAVGPWEDALPALPTGHSRVMVLTPSGPHFGQGPDAALRAEPIAAAFLAAATRTLVAVLEATRTSG